MHTYPPLVSKSNAFNLENVLSFISTQWALILSLWAYGVRSSTAARGHPYATGVAPRLLSLVYSQEFAEDRESSARNEPHMEVSMTDFVRERHSRNEQGSSIHMFYDTLEGSSILDAWTAQLTDEDILEFEQTFGVRCSL